MKLILAIASAVILSACGGGGGGSAPTQQTTTTCKSRGPVLSASPVLIAYGDSTMYGQRAMLRDALQESGRAVEFDNRGIGSTRLAQLLEGSCEYQTTFAAELAKDQAGKVVIENFGINEAFRLRSPFEFERNLIDYVSTVRSKGMVPVIVTPIHILNSTDVSPALLATLTQVARDVAASEGVALIDVYTLNATVADFTPGLIHPNDAFYKRIAEFEAAELIRLGLI